MEELHSRLFSLSYHVSLHQITVGYSSPENSMPSWLIPYALLIVISLFSVFLLYSPTSQTSHW